MTATLYGIPASHPVYAADADARAQGHRVQAGRPAAVVPPADAAVAALPRHDRAGARARRPPAPDHEGDRACARRDPARPAAVPPTRTIRAGRGDRDLVRRRLPAAGPPGHVLGAGPPRRGRRRLPRGLAPDPPALHGQAAGSGRHPHPRARPQVARRGRPSGPRDAAGPARPDRRLDRRGRARRRRAERGRLPGRHQPGAAGQPRRPAAHDRRAARGPARWSASPRATRGVCLPRSRRTGSPEPPSRPVHRASRTSPPRPAAPSPRT